MKNAFVFFALLGHFAAGAQPGNAVPKNIRAANTLENLFDASGLTTSDNFYGIPLEPGDVVGNAYLNPEWRRTTFLLYNVDKMIEGYPARYEIGQDQFEIKTSRGIKVLNGSKVKSFVWVDSATRTPHYFVNGRDFDHADHVTFTGFYEVLAEGNLILLCKTAVIVKDPTYNDKFDMGQRNTRILKKRHFYYVDQNEVREVPSSRKKFFSIFGPHADEVGSFANVNKLSIDDAGHLTSIFRHYNSLRVTN